MSFCLKVLTLAKLITTKPWFPLVALIRTRRQYRKRTLNNEDDRTSLDSMVTVSGDRLS